MKGISAKTVLEYQQKLTSKTTIGEYKRIGRELRDKYGLSDIEAIDLINGRNVTQILAKCEDNEYE